MSADLLHGRGRCHLPNNHDTGAACERLVGAVSPRLGDARRPPACGAGALGLVCGRLHPGVSACTSPPSPINRDTDAATSNNASTAPHLLPLTVVMVTRLGDCALDRVSSSPSSARGIPNHVHDGSRAATMEHIADAGAPGHRMRMCMKTQRAEGVQTAAGGDNRLPDLVRSDHDERIYA